MEHLHEALDHLAGLVAGVTEDGPGRHVLAGVVVDVERMAGAELPGRDDALPVLVRRFARAHRLLLRAGSVRGHAAERVERHAAVLQDPLAALMSAWGELQSARPDGAAVGTSGRGAERGAGLSACGVGERW